MSRSSFWEGDVVKLRRSESTPPWRLVLLGLAAFGCPVSIGSAAGQVATPQTPAFDVVSVKPNGSAFAMLTPGVPGRNPTYAHNSPGRLSWNQSLSYFIEQAYQVARWQISGPDWLPNDAYQFEATMPTDTDKATVRLMLRFMLADRFKLSLHTVPKDVAVYNLVVARGGPKLIPAENPEVHHVRQESGHFSWTAVTTEEMALSLAHRAGRPVMDMTGLKGVYQVDLKWSPDPGASMDSDTGILSAIGQVGLRLESGKKRFDTLVIDHIERKPTPN